MDAIDSDFSDVALIAESDASALGLKNSDVIQLSAIAGMTDGFPSEFVTCALQVVVQKTTKGTDRGSREVGVHPDIAISPLMYDILCTASAMAGTVNNAGDGNDLLSYAFPVRVSQVGGPMGFTKESTQEADAISWAARKVGKVHDLSAGSSVRLSVLCLDDELEQFCEESGDFTDALQFTVSFFLGGRILMEGTAAAIDTEEGIAIVTVQQIRERNNSSDNHDVAYRLGVCVNYELSIDVNLEDHIGPNSIGESLGYKNFSLEQGKWQTECPGYGTLVCQVVKLASIKGAAAPSGIILTGSPQVGKTHLASCVAHHLSRSSVDVHWVSVQDLLLHASWADEADLKSMLRPPAHRLRGRAQLLVLDDLHVFESEESSLGEDSVSLNIDQEMLVVKNAVLHVIDELSAEKQSDSHNEAAAVVGIAQSASGLPPEFVKSGRLEKEIAMLPPTESQRAKILMHLIPAVSSGQERSEKVMKRWAEALAPVTVGCVAGDLRRILADAWTRALSRSGAQNPDFSQPLTWDDLQKAVQTYIPMQLQSVDVCKPNYPFTFTEDKPQKLSSDMEKWAGVHRLSWSRFGGYPLVKKRLLRTVVVPWKLFLKSLDHNPSQPTMSVGLSPPPGVLFHGESGTGKSLAAVCLASSLGLPMIKIKAADVMDKWLGGSEAIIRGLFTRARSAAPCVLFFDEIDSLATNRASGDEGGAEVMARLLSTLLNEMDGISNDRQSQSVLVIACTNRLEDLDSALLRPGRLEEHIELKRPDASDIRDIFRVHLSRVPLSDQIHLDDLSRSMAENNASGAEIEGLCHDACLQASHRAATSDNVVLTLEDFQSCWGSGEKLM